MTVSEFATSPDEELFRNNWQYLFAVRTYKQSKCMCFIYAYAYVYVYMCTYVLCLQISFESFLQKIDVCRREIAC